MRGHAGVHERGPNVSAAPTGRARRHSAEARTEIVPVRLSPTEKSRIEGHARRAGLALSSYMAQVALAGGGDPEQLPLEPDGVDPEQRRLRVLLQLHEELEAAAGDSVRVAEIAERVDVAIADLAARR
jgi:hypothetical protein